LNKILNEEMLGTGELVREKLSPLFNRIGLVRTDPHPW
jgi:hypothetical protein